MPPWRRPARRSDSAPPAREAARGKGKGGKDKAVRALRNASPSRGILIKDKEKDKEKEQSFLQQES
eukprot:771247-Pyramimonas_sp.AAC.1